MLWSNKHSIKREEQFYVNEEDIGKMPCVASIIWMQNIDYGKEGQRLDRGF